MQPRNSQEALGQLQTFQSSRKNPQDLLREREANLGVPTQQQRLVGLRGAIQNSENALKAVDPSVSGRTQGSLVTEAQKSRLIAMEREPIAQQISDQNRTLENETANYNELSRRALQDAQLQISADDQRQNTLQGIYSTLYQREQDDIARQERERAFQAQQAEARRQAAASSSMARLMGGGNNGGQTLPGGMSEKRDLLGNFQGFAFTDKAGKPVSAATYAAQNGIGVGDLLYKMAQSGDATAQQAYKWIQSIQGSDMFKSGKWKNTSGYQKFSSLFWGS